MCNILGKLEQNVIIFIVFHWSSKTLLSFISLVTHHWQIIWKLCSHRGCENR